MRTFILAILLLTIATPAHAQKKRPKKKPPAKVIVLEDFCILRAPIPRPRVLFVIAQAKTPETPLPDDRLYLQGIAQADADNLEAAALTFETLIARHPTSRHIKEARFRAAQAHFHAHALDKAAKALQRAARDPTHTLHDDALYMLAWTRFRQDRLAESIALFVRLLNAYEADPKRPETLRDESIAFIAAILVDDDWNMDGQRDKITPLQRAQTHLKGLTTDFDRLDALAAVKKLDKEVNVPCP